jgi:hypothetical protein
MQQFQNHNVLLNIDRGIEICTYTILIFSSLARSLLGKSLELSTY